MFVPDGLLVSCVLIESSDTRRPSPSRSIDWTLFLRSAGAQSSVSGRPSQVRMAAHSIVAVFCGLADILFFSHDAELI